MPMNAGIAQSGFPSPTLYLLHINNMLEDSNVHCHVDDNTEDAVYAGRESLSREDVDLCRNKHLSSVEVSFRNISVWGDRNLV